MTSYILTAKLDAARAMIANLPEYKRLTRDFERSLEVIRGIDQGTERGYSRPLFVNSIIGKVRTVAKRDVELAGVLLAWLDSASGWWGKPAITSRNKVWTLCPHWEQYKVLFVRTEKGAARPVTPLLVSAAEPSEDVPMIEPGNATDGSTYQVVSIREDTGARTVMTNPPLTHEEACTVRGTLTEHAYRRLAIEPIPSRPMRHQTNVECVVDIMEYSRVGAMSQVFVMDSLTKRADRVAALTDEEADALTNDMIDGRAWRNAARAVKEKLDLHFAGKAMVPDTDGDGDED